MVHRQVTLDTAAFLDSEEARALTDVPEAARRRIAELFLTIAYDELGKKPRLFDGHDLHAALGHQMPAHLARKDPLAAHVPAVMTAYLAHLEATEVVTQSFELHQALDDTLAEFQEAVRTGHVAHHAATKTAPLVHQAPKHGRNEPCFCGSGKKFKKCHGK
jgi:hypothetical protein